MTARGDHTPRLVVLGCLLALAVGCTAVPEPDFLLRHVHVVDTATGEVARDRAIAVADGRILSITAESEAIAAPVNAVSIDGAGAYAVPGLWDAHVHLMQGGPDAALADAAALLAAGVTHVRDMGAGSAQRREFLARATEAGAPLPHVIGSGPPLWTFDLPYGDPAQRMVVRTDAEIAAAVAKLADEGVQFIKVYEGFDERSLAALTRAARARRLRVSGHPQKSVTLERHADLGVLSVEHLDFGAFAECVADADAYFDRVIASRFSGAGESIPAIYSAFGRKVDTPDCRAALARAATKGLAITPTLSATYMPEETARAAAAALSGERREACDLYLKQFSGLSAPEKEELSDAGRRMMRVVTDAGFPIVAGTDAPVFCASPGGALAVELALLSDAGLSNLEVLQAATATPARLFGFEEVYGRIAAGKPADIVLLRGNPLASASAYAAPIGVFTGGVWLGAPASSDP